MRGNGEGKTHEIFELPPGLLDDAVLPVEDDAHPTEVAHFGRADDERVDVEASCGEDAGDAGEDTRLILDEAVEDVPAFRRDPDKKWPKKVTEKADIVQETWSSRTSLVF